MTSPDPGTTLVTGGAGFIGSALVWALNRRGIERIVVVDRLGSDEKWRNLAPLRFEEYVEAENFFPRLHNGTLGAFDCVLHMGACSATTEKDASYLARNNYEFTKDLATWALGHSARFVYASSAATYGAGAQGMLDVDEPDALTRLRPLNAYGWSKHVLDQYAAHHGLFARGAVGVKYFNVFGPNEAHKGDMRSLVHKAFEQVRDTGTVRLFKSYSPSYADGEQERDFLYVKDAVAMTLHLAVHPEARGLYNLGSGRARTWLALAHALFAAMGKPPRIEFIEMPEQLRGKYQYHTLADITKLRGAGYAQPVTELEAAVADYVKHYQLDDRRLGVPEAESEAPVAAAA